MGKVKPMEKVSLVIFCFGPFLDVHLTRLLPRLEERFGQVEYVSPLMDFGKYTMYYNREMGNGPIEGKFLSFRELVSPDQLISIKLFTNDLEQEVSVDGRRTINLDPGYIHASQFVLASTKHWANRIYLGKGIYAEITLMYVHGGFQPLPYTYRNYADPEYRQELEHIRRLYLEKRKKRATRTVEEMKDSD